jgi:DNA repair exonuclease SbcCD ATPase subunit
MRVSCIELEGVASHTTPTTVALPETGLVLVTGENGSGKSTLIQGLPLALWGKLVARSGSLWRVDEKGLAAATVDGVRYERRRSAKGKLKFGWTDGPTYERATDAQAAAVERLGSPEHWAATYLLDQAAAFGSGTDADRKRLLEAAVGLGRLDEAHQRALEVVRRGAAQRSTADQARAQAQGARQEAAAAVERLAPLQEAPLPAEPPSPTKLQAALQAADREAREAEELWRADQRRRDAAKSAVDRAADVVRRMQQGTCPTCGQTVGAAEAARAQTALEAAQAALEATAADGDPQALATAARELAAERQCIADALATARQGERTWHEGTKARAAYGDAVRRLTELEDVVEKARFELEAATEAHEAAALAAAALSPKGARAQLLEATCAWIGHAASRWLAIGFPGVGVKVSASRPAAGKGDDPIQAVTLTVTRDGVASGSPSRGELRRTDLALTLALAELREAANGTPPGTLFLDEPLDVLDPTTGVEGAVRILAEAARERCIVIVAHSAAPVVAQVAAQWLRVDHGVVERVR